MSITDELRAWAKEHLSRSSILAIADRIDAEHERAMADAYLSGTPTDEKLTELGWIRMPKDADGEYIHVGDVMEWPYGNGEFRVNGIGGNTLFYIDKDSGECEWTAAGDKRHHHAPTVEGVLLEFAEKITDSQVPGVHPTYEEAIAEYAAKLRLAGDE